MDGHPRQNPAYRPATEKPRSGGAFLCLGERLTGPVLDGRGAGGRREHRRVPVVPANAEPRRILLEHLLDDACAMRLADLLGLDGDRVSGLDLHLRPPPLFGRRRDRYMRTARCLLRLTRAPAPAASPCSRPSSLRRPAAPRPG